MKDAISKIKRGKQSGPDLIKGEIIKWLKNSEICIQALTGAINRVVENGEICETWKHSKTVMIPKKAKPEVKNF